MREMAMTLITIKIPTKIPTKKKITQFPYRLPLRRLYSLNNYTKPWPRAINSRPLANMDMMNSYVWSTTWRNKQIALQFEGYHWNHL
jgi:hypothetical protein